MSRRGGFPTGKGSPPEFGPGRGVSRWLLIGYIEGYQGV